MAPENYGYRSYFQSYILLDIFAIFRITLYEQYTADVDSGPPSDNNLARPKHTQRRAERLHSSPFFFQASA